MKIIQALSWYPYVFLFFLIFIVLFRGEISFLIKRINKLGKDGVSVDIAPEAQREEADTAAVQQLLEAVGNSVVVADLEGRIKTELTNKGFSTDGDTIKVLIRHLAGTQLLLSFEQIHGLIFGSQIFLLKKLNEVTGQGISLISVNSHIDNTKELYPLLNEWSHEQYLQFLYSHQLIIRHDQQLHITNMGVEYLTWVVRNGRKEDKPL